LIHIVFSAQYQPATRTFLGLTRFFFSGCSNPEQDALILDTFDDVEFFPNDFDYVIPKPEPPPKTDGDDDD
jgi:hypothetical protein